MEYANTMNKHTYDSPGSLCYSGLSPMLLWPQLMLTAAALDQEAAVVSAVTCSADIRKLRTILQFCCYPAC